MIRAQEATIKAAPGLELPRHAALRYFRAADLCPLLKARWALRRVFSEVWPFAGLALVWRNRRTVTLSGDR
jgi:hypothetical protein